MSQTATLRPRAHHPPFTTLPTTRPPSHTPPHPHALVCIVDARLHAVLHHRANQLGVRLVAHPEHRLGIDQSKAVGGGLQQSGMAWSGWAGAQGMVSWCPSMFHLVHQAAPAATSSTQASGHSRPLPLPHLQVVQRLSHVAICGEHHGLQAVRGVRHTLRLCE